MSQLCSMFEVPPGKREEGERRRGGGEWEARETQAGGCQERDHHREMGGE